MKMDDFKKLLSLPGPVQYRSYLEERLETLSVREGCALAAVLQRAPPRDMEEAVDCLNSLDGYEVQPAGNYEELGALYLRKLNVPEEVLPHADLGQLGQMYEDEHPGLFVGNCYAAYPNQPSFPARQENGAPVLWDSDWSVKLKLASPAVPEGVWLRLPDFSAPEPGQSIETELVLKELKVQCLEDCTPLEARCILPEVGDLLKQYSTLEELIGDGDYLGYVMAERGQGEPHWMEKFAAALEYEGCRTLKFALDISQNLQCYEWVSGENLEDFAVKHLRSCNVSEELIQSGAIDLAGYAKDLLESSGYMQTSGETGYLIRNGREFVQDFTAPREKAPAQRDILKAFLFLDRLSGYASPEDADSARTVITEAIADRGADGIRQLQAAMEYEDCADLKEAVEIAGHLDCYDFMDMGDFYETAKRELLAKGLDKRLVEFCINYESYAAITHDYEDIYSSRNTGLYVHRNDAMSQLEQGSMTMQ